MTAEEREHLINYHVTWFLDRIAKGYFTLEQVLQMFEEARQARRSEGQSVAGALILAGQAIDHLLTLTPSLDAFNLVEVQAAHKLLTRTHRYQPDDNPTLMQARIALHCVIGRLQRGNRVKVRPNGPWRNEFVMAGAFLPAFIEQAKKREDQYWQNFTEEALAEVGEIIPADLSLFEAVAAPAWYEWTEDSEEGEL